MKEAQTATEKIIVIDIRLTRGLVMALSCVLVLAALATFLTLTGDSASASETEAVQAASTGMRQFYLSILAVDGTDALTACAAGYHMASLWEIVDPSNLAYNTALGRTEADSGQGPPTSYESGWVRTGYDSSDSSTAGMGNCEAWTTGGVDEGTLVNLPSQWTAGLGDIGVWEATNTPCQFGYPVWCIED
jgi:hypothetical protein